ncbi:hypothetical protein FB451DRAFT_1392459 [Mycena latifolia]|nr:hypothetical protein FB451DRAFT_1392459 [Mycena latifolia]
MRELNGKQGLLPTPYTKVLPERPLLRSRPGASNHLGLEMDSNGDLREEDEDEDEDTHEQYGRPLAAASHGSPFYGGLGDPDATSIVSSVDDDRRRLVRPVPARPTPPRRATTSDLGSMGAQGKKAPPPPPPRRGTSSAAAGPLIPERRPPSRGSPAPRPGYASAASSESSHTQLPFESAAEDGCGDFKQNPFKPKGMCSNCFEFHTG